MDRDTKQLNTQGRNHFALNFQVIYVAGAPTFVEGDKANLTAQSGSYVSLVQTGAGVLTVTTINPFPGFVRAKANLFMVTPNGNSLAPITGKAVQNANGTWSVSINTAVNAAGTHTATTPANGDGFGIELVLRNSTSLP